MYSSAPRWTHYCFLCFYFSCWLVEWKVPLFERRWTVCGSFKINTMTWVFFFGCVLLILTMICFAFFWWKEWQVLDGVAVLGHFQHCSVIRLSCLDELMNNDILLSLSFAWYVLQRRSSILVEPFGLWRLMFYFVFLCKKWQHLFWMEFCKRGVEEKSWMDSSDCEESVVFV